jgi:uncharacterized repeat protein (TIGR01451 family)
MGVANSSSSIANNFLGGGAAHAFRIQREWSNAVSGCAASYTTTGSGVESPVPTGSDVTEAVTEATIAGNNGDTLHYSTSFRNPSNQDDAYSITITDTLPTGVSGSSSFSLGNLAPHRTVSQSFTDTVSGGPLLDGTVLTNSAKFDFRDSTTAAQPSITRSASTTVSNASPALVLPGAQSQDYHDGLSFGISATDANAGDTVSLSASGLPAGLSFTDNGDRTGTVSGTISAAPGPYTVMFTANDHHHLTMVTQSLVITVLREETTTTYTGVTGAVLDGSTVTLSGVLNEDGTTPISAATLTMTLGSGATAQTCFGTTNAAGSASCDIVVHQSVGPKPVSATFAGDVFYLGSSGSGSVVIFTAKSLKQDTLAQATALLAGAAKRDSENLETVVKKLTDALTPSLWVDGNHVDSHQGGKVFDREKEVVSTLESIIKNKKSAIPDATSQAMIDALVHADRILAEDALADAVAATGDPKRIAEAQRELVRAAAELAVGDFDGAIENYKGCWKKAQDAV